MTSPLGKTESIRLESLQITLESIKVTDILLSKLTPDKKVLKGSLTEEIFATEKASKLVKKGMAFRKAYHEVKNYERYFN